MYAALVCKKQALPKFSHFKWLSTSRDEAFKVGKWFSSQFGNQNRNMFFEANSDLEMNEWAPCQRRVSNGIMYVLVACATACRGHKFPLARAHACGGISKNYSSPAPVAIHHCSGWKAACSPLSGRVGIQKPNELWGNFVEDEERKRPSDAKNMNKSALLIALLWNWTKNCRYHVDSEITFIFLSELTTFGRHYSISMDNFEAI